MFESYILTNALLFIIIY